MIRVLLRFSRFFLDCEASFVTRGKQGTITMQGLWKATQVAILLCVVTVQSEPDYVLPGGQPQSGASTIVLTNPGKPYRGPTILSPAHHHHHHHHQKPRTKIVESYLSSEFTVFGGGRPSHSYTRHPIRYSYRLPHPNSIPRGPPQKPFEVVRAPVIYHQTVTDTDVTQALADAFDVVEKLRKPGNKIKALPQDDSPIRNNIEYVNLPQNGRTATTTTTIVEAPQQLDVNKSPRSQYYRSPAVNIAQVTLVDQSNDQQLPHVPSAADVPPPPLVYATTAPIDDTNSSVLPAVTTSNSPAPAPKLIIPSQSHVTTLEQAVQSVDNQIRTIIQPVYIPYPVDQNGRAIGPLPDYHSMDFGALLSAQHNILESMRGPPPIQFVEAQPLNQQQQQPQLQQQYFIQTDQSVAAADDVPSSPTLRTKTRKRIARRRNSARRI